MPSKKVIIISSLVVAIFLVLFFIYISFVSSKTISARLLVEKEKVFVNGEEIFGSAILEEQDEVVTSATGSATIILYESVVVILSPDTTIKVDELSKMHPKLSQERGETWSQFTKLLGVEKYTIKTSTSVASVRGTGFLLSEALLLVGEGEVDYDFMDKSYVVNEGRAVGKFGEVAEERNLTLEEKEKVFAKKQEAIESLKQLRLIEIEKNKKIIEILKEKYEITDEDISDYLRQADEGEIDLNEFKEKIPVQLESVEKVISITEKIKEIKSSL